MLQIVNNLILINTKKDKKEMQNHGYLAAI